MPNLFNHNTGKDLISIITKYTLKIHGAHDRSINVFDWNHFRLFVIFMLLSLRYENQGQESPTLR